MAFGPPTRVPPSCTILIIAIVLIPLAHTTTPNLVRLLKCKIFIQFASDQLNDETILLVALVTVPGIWFWKDGDTTVTTPKNCLDVGNCTSDFVIFETALMTHR